MKKSILFLLILMITAMPAKSPDKNEIKKKVAKLLSQMTLEEKVGQMTQITLEVISSKQGRVDQKHVLNEKGLEDAILKYHVGSILNVFDVAHSVDYWHEILNKIHKVSMEKSRLKVPVIYGIDAIHGATYTTNATLFPQAISLAASFNKELAMQAGKVTSEEVRASGIPWNFYPVMDLGRQVLWPRFWETFGEDVYLTSTMGSEYIKGAQGSDVSAKNKLMTCLKHFVGYSYPASGKDRTPAWISERMMREYFLPSFEAGIKAGALTVMVNSAEVDGIPTHSDYHLLTEVLRGEMKFEGFVVSDWEDIKRLYTRDRVASSPEEAVKMAVMAGVDMSMVPQDYTFYTILVELVKSKQVPMKRIDEAVSRILYVKYLLGLFENPFPDKNLMSLIGTKENEAINLQAATESIVLTQNKDNYLPLKQVGKLLVTGPTANMLSPMNGGWTITWQGNEESLYPANANTVLEALQVKFGKDKVIYSEGSTFNADVNTAATVELAKNSDAVVICLGEKAYCETPGNIDELELDEAQLKLVEEISKVNKNIILVMIEGRPRIIRKVTDKVKSIFVAMLPGMRGGDALAQLISGDAVPSGKLPFSYPKHSASLYHYDYKPIEGANENKYDPQWSFGYGLSYTSFAYSNLKINKDSYSIGESIVVTVDVKNTGTVTGKESVLLYLCDKYGSVSRPVRQLKAMEKISLAPGEVKTVTLTLTGNDLSFIGRDNKRIVEKGDFIIYAGNLEKQFAVK